MKRFRVKVERYGKSSNLYCIRYSNNFGLSYSVLKEAWWLHDIYHEPIRYQPMLDRFDVIERIAKSITCVDWIREYNTRESYRFDSYKEQYNSMIDALPKSKQIL